MKTTIFTTKNTLILLYFTLFYVSTFAQKLIEFRGKVLDADSNNKLALADLTLSNSNISTITNKEGEFLLKIPENQASETLIVSFLGYKKLEIKISELPKENAKIYLQPAATVLASVDIIAPKDAKSLVLKTLKTRGDNYINDNIYMTGFYRETIKKRNRNASLAEALVSIEKQPYLSSKTDRVTLIKSRKQTNYERLDTLALKLQGGPFGTLYTDVIKYPEYIFNDDNINDYDFTFERSTEKNNRLVYVVNFKQKPFFSQPMYYGKLFIDAQTFALTHADYHLNVENETEAASYFVKKKPRKAEVIPTEANYKVNYRVKNGKWYYSYSNILLTFKVKWKTKWFNSKYTLNSEMAITDWDINQQNISSNENKKLRPNSILQEEASGFNDPEFWGEYNIIEPEKSIESAIKKISKNLNKV